MTGRGGLQALTDGRGYGWVGCRKISTIVGLEMAQGLAGGWYVWPVDGGGWQPQGGGDDPKQVRVCMKIDVWVGSRPRRMEEGQMGGGSDLDRWDSGWGPDQGHACAKHRKVDEN